MNKILLFLIGGCAPALSPFFIKKYFEKKDIMWIILSVCSYLVLIYVYLIILENKNENIIIIYPLLKVISVLIALFLGMYFFNEKLDIKTGLGIIFALISIFLLYHK